MTQKEAIEQAIEKFKDARRTVRIAGFEWAIEFEREMQEGFALLEQAGQGPTGRGSMMNRNIEQAIRRFRRREAIALAKVGIEMALIVLGLFVIAYYLLILWVAMAGS